MPLCLVSEHRTMRRNQSAQVGGKVTYLLAAPGTPYIVGVGIYHPTITVEDLDQLSGG